MLNMLDLVNSKQIKNQPITAQWDYWGIETEKMVNNSKCQEIISGTIIPYFKKNEYYLVVDYSFLRYEKRNINVNNNF